ncbi:MAG TPA: hypothetical protein PLC97_06250 [Myxococcota bacterium]|nr:hypothetical protein [Myxococcota bacterium]
MNMQVAIVGPTKAGKTVYLACLLRAALAPRIVARPIRVRPDPESPAAMRLSKDAVEILRGGAPLATTEVTEFELWADLPGSLLGGLGKDQLRLRMVDMPGGDTMPPPDCSIPIEVQRSVAGADALLIVIPADSSVRPEDLGARLQHLVSTSMGLRSYGVGAYPFQRVAVVLTMSELLVLQHGSAALGVIEGLKAAEQVRDLCGSDFVREVRALVPPGGDWYSLVSAFGFDLNTGEVPIESTALGWRLRLNGASFLDEWCPYRVFEPLEFLARGVCWREAY